MQQLFTTEDTESTEKCQRILINWGRATGSPLQSDGYPDFNLFVDLLRKCKACPVMLSSVRSFYPSPRPPPRIIGEGELKPAELVLHWRFSL